MALHTFVVNSHSCPKMHATTDKYVWQSIAVNLEIVVILANMAVLAKSCH